MSVQPASLGASIIIWTVVAVVLLYRLSRPQRTSVTRMWITAGILMVLAAYSIYEGEVLFPAPLWEIALAVVLGIAAGIPVGILRGHHTQVAATDRHGVMQLGASWATAGIYLGAFVVRGVIRAMLPATSSIGSVVGDGLMVFAIAIVGVTYLVIFRKYEQLDHQVKAAA